MRINLNVKVVFLIVAVILITTITLGTISFSTAKKALIKSVQKGLNTESEKIALQIEEFNEKEFNLLRCLANMPMVKDENVPLDEKCRQLKLMVDGDPGKYENISYYNKEGNSYNRDGIYHSSAHKDYFQAAIQGKEFVCDPFYSDVGKKVLQIFSVPVYTGNEITGVVTAILYGDHLTEIVKQIDVGGGFHPAIINRNTSQTIANANEGVDDGSSGNEMDQESEIAKVLNSVMAGDSDTRQFRDPSIGVDMIASYRPIGKTAPWSVFCVVPAIVFYMDLIKIRVAIIVTIVISVILANVLGFLLIKIFLKPLMKVKSAINDIGSGNADLTKRLNKTSSDEIGEIVDGFNNFAGNLQTIMKSIKEANHSLESVGSNLNSKTADTESAIAEIIANIDTMHSNIDEQVNSVTETSGAVNEIASNIESLERMIGNQSSSVSQASTAVEQMIGNISSVNNSMDKMASSFEQLSLSAKSGSSLQAVANERIETIKGQSETLLEANLAIAEIAEQTNLLAMNAAIEAAHAGDAGKGFSVVADEIRKLSETSSEQSRTIGVQLTNIRESIEQMVGAAQQSTEAFHDVTTKISETDEVVRQIKAAMEEQEIGSKQITSALHSMNDSTLEVRTASKEMAEGNKAILEEIKNLQNTTTSMRQSMSEMSNGAKKINENGIELDVLSETLKENISNIGEQINQFVV